MSMLRPHVHGLHCILPPELLQQIARRGSRAQRDKALWTLAQDMTFRSLRQAAVSQVPARRRITPAGQVVAGKKQRVIYDVHNKETLPGKAVRAEGQEPVKDAAVNEAYDGLGRTYDLFWEVFGRNSISGDGEPLLAHVHYGDGYNNAFWDGRRMVFGDGDGELFQRFTIAIDVIGHELGHGVIEDEGSLGYVTQSGALNESIADVFGSLVKQRTLGQTAEQADWLIGQGLFMSGVNAQALRSMKQPGTAYDDAVLGKDPQPDHMDKYVHTTADHGGVHINSGIPNRAFVLTASGIGGNAWEKPGRIWYEALCDDRLLPDANFAQFAALTIDAAKRLYGGDSDEQAAVTEAWDTVGVNLSVPVAQGLRGLHTQPRAPLT